MAGRPCSMCSHPDKAAIEAALVDGRPVRAIGKEWRVSRDAIARHRGHMLLPLAQAQEVRAAVQEQVAADVAQALDVMDQLTRVFERTNLLLDACHRWLVDPEDPSRYDVGPRSSDVMVIYLDAGADGKERQRKAPLDVLLARLGEGGVARDRKSVV